ncbi:MAG: ECF transporter S component [Oscillospiraceae bacterium]
MKTKTMEKTKNLVISALCIALGVILPIAFHAIPNAGSVFLPMHIPVLLCGLICGPIYGLVCGIFAPLISSLLTGMPPMAYLPSMLCELAVYGAVSGLLYGLLKRAGVKQIGRIYTSLIGAMIFGRIVSGLLKALIFNFGEYSIGLWVTSMFVTGLPGIVTQIIVIPILLIVLQKAKLID